MRVLIADDNVSQRVLVEKLFARSGAMMEFAGTGTEALRLYRAKHHDVLVLDHLMPGLEGIDVLRQLQGDLGNTHVIMVTGAVTPELVKTIRSESLKVDDLMPKPMDIDRFQSRVVELTNRYRQRNRRAGPVITQGIKDEVTVPSAPTLAYSVIDRGNQVILEITGALVEPNKSVVGAMYQDVKAISGTSAIIDITGVNDIDTYGLGTLTVLAGWLSEQEIVPCLRCSGSPVRDRVVSLRITDLIPECEGDGDDF